MPCLPGGQEVHARPKIFNRPQPATIYPLDSQSFTLFDRMGKTFFFPSKAIFQIFFSNSQKDPEYKHFFAPCMKTFFFFFQTQCISTQCLPCPQGHTPLNVFCNFLSKTANQRRGITTWHSQQSWHQQHYLLWRNSHFCEG